MTFVEFPGFLDGNIVFIQFVENMVESMNGPFKIGRIGFIKFVAIFFQQLACLNRFLMTFFGKIDIRPTGELVFLIPFTFAMTDQNQFFSWCASSYIVSLY